MTDSNTITHIVSYPKSGRTWLRLLIAKYLDELAEQGTTLEDLDVLTAAAGIAPIELSHAGGHLPNRELPSKRQLTRKYKGQRVLFVARNFEDTLVSSYFQARYRKDLFDGTLSDFIRAPSFGAPRLRKYFDCWADVRAKTADFCLIRYEHMHHDPAHCLGIALTFCGIERPDQSLTQSAIDFCAFDNLQKMEREDKFTKRAFRARDTSKVETYKFRQGQVGSYGEYMSSDDLDYLRKFLAGNRNGLLRSDLAGTPSCR